MLEAPDDLDFLAQLQQEDLERLLVIIRARIEEATSRRKAPILVYRVTLFSQRTLPREPRPPSVDYKKGRTAEVTTARHPNLRPSHVA